MFSPVGESYSTGCGIELPACLGVMQRYVKNRLNGTSLVFVFRGRQKLKDFLIAGICVINSFTGLLSPAY